MIRIIILFLIWRLLLFFTAYISPTLIPTFGNTFPYANTHLMLSGLPHYLWSFANFDGVHYLIIAKDGYSHQFTQAFFPFYPALIKLVSQLTSGNFILSALFVSNVSFLTGLIIFNKLITTYFNKKIAFWSCLFLLSFPTSFFFGSVYTEGLFFLLVTSSFYMLSRNKIIAASVLGAVASGTRFMGLFLTPSILLSKSKKKFIALLVVPIGFVSYVTYLKLRFNDPLYFLTSQKIFGNERSTNSIVPFPQVVYRYIKILLTTDGLLFSSALLELTATIFALSTLLIFRKKIPKEWLAFSLFSVLVPPLTGTFTSMPRYVIIAFPIYIALAHIKNALSKIVIIIIFMIMLFVLTSLFTQGYWVA